MSKFLNNFFLVESLNENKIFYRKYYYKFSFLLYFSESSLAGNITNYKCTIETLNQNDTNENEKGLQKHANKSNTTS